MAAAVEREEHAACARAVREAFGPAVHVVATTVLRGDASSRRYVRLALAGPGAPATAIAMILGEGRFAPGADELAEGIAFDELPFVNVGRWLAARGFPVPALYCDAARRDGLLLLEDVGDATLWAAASAAPQQAAELFGQAVDLLVRLQVEGVHCPDRACYAFVRRFDPQLARRELEHFVEHGIETRRGRPLAPRSRATLLEALAPVAAPFAALDPVLVHRDFMAWNLHVQDGRLRLLDFQDALLGPDAYDLAALLTDRTTATLVPPPLETELIARFAAGRAAAGLPLAGDLSERYRLCALHRALKVIGRFHFLELVQRKPGYLAYLPAVYAVARRMLALAPLGDLQRRLAEHVPELAPV
jgi:aminoglycoside/choline kinase family phosphotransferase